VKIYAVADIHGRKSRLERIRSAAAAARPDLVVIAGDITGFGNQDDFLAGLDSLNLPILAVPGNTDSAELEKDLEKYPNILSIQLRKEVIDGVSFIGLGGTLSVPFVEKLRPKDNRGLDALAEDLGDEDILVTHTPPWGILDRGFASLHGGSRWLRELLERRHPRLLICGHIHEDRGAATVERTTVVNCSMGRKGAGALIKAKKGGGMEIAFL